MNILQKDDGKNGLFYIEQEDKILAEMTYSWAGANRIIINHTEVSETLSGKGIGKELIAKAVEFARANNIKISPVCPYAKTVFEKTEAYSTVLF